MPVFATVVPRLQPGLAALAFTAAAALPAAPLDVWVDFTTDFHDGNDGAPNGVADWIDELNEATQRAVLSVNAETSSNTFNTAQREQIQTNILGELRRIYTGTTVNFVTERPAGLHDVIYFGQDNDNAGVGTTFGSAQGDFANINTLTYSAFNLSNPSGNPGSVPKVAPANFNSFLEPRFDSLDQAITEISNSLAGTAAHELGHSFGLFHHFAYSAQGITPDNFNNTGGLQNQHIIATGPTGLNEAERENGTRTFSPFSQVILDVAGGLSSLEGAFSRENSTIVENPISSDDSELQNGDAGNTLATAQTLTFDTGTLSGAEISFIEADLDGSSNDVDLFRFDIPVEANFSAHVFSERLLFAREFDPTLTLLDSNGETIAFSDDVDYNNDSISVDGSEPLDSGDTSFEDDAFLFNILLAAGTYYIEIAPTDVEISDTPNAGDQYALVTSLVLIPEPTTTAVLALGSLALIRRRRGA